jgi:hypothetical protein
VFEEVAASGDGDGSGADTPGADEEDSHDGPFFCVVDHEKM